MNEQTLHLLPNALSIKFYPDILLMEFIEFSEWNDFLGSNDCSKYSSTLPSQWY